MNGPTKVLLDTNAVIALLRGHAGIQQCLAAATWVGVSVITVLEFRSFSRLTQSDQSLFHVFCGRSEVVGIAADNAALLTRIIEVRRGASVKLPDAIIAGTALMLGCTVVTADAGFTKVSGLSVLSFQP